MPSFLPLQRLITALTGFLIIAAAAAETPDINQLESRIQRFTTKSGLQVALLPKPASEHRVLGYLKLRYGDEKSLTGQRMVADMTATMLSSGTEKSSYRQLTERLDKLNAHIALNTEEDFVGFRFDVPRDALPALLEWIAEVLRTPVFPEQEWRMTRERLTIELKEYGSRAELMADEELARRTNPYPQGDPRRQTSIDERLAALATITREDLVRFHAGFYGADSGEVAMVGDFDAEQTRQNLERLFSDWHNRIAYLRAPRPFHAPEPGSFVVATSGNAQGQYRAMLRMPLHHDSREAVAITLAAQVLGGMPASGRLSERLRHREGMSQLAVAVTAFSAFEDSGNMRILAAYPPAQRKRLQAVVHEELQRLADDGITADELAQAKDVLLRQSRQSRESDGALLAQLPVQLRTGRTMQSVAAREAVLNSLTTEEVNASIRKHLQPAKLVEVFADAE